MSQIKVDYYELLMVSRTATTDEIKKSFKRLAMEYHPDRNPGNREAEEKFKQIAEAHEVLSNAERRSLYDRYGHDGPRQAGFEGFGGVEDILSNFAEMFSGFGFGGGGRRAGREQGEDLQLEMTISFLEAARGSQKEIEIDRLIACQTCGGSGAQKGTTPQTCTTCRGHGQVATQQGFLTIATTCPTCRGQGQIIREKCTSCRGGGRATQRDKVSVTIPAGIDNGQTLRVTGKGHVGRSGGNPGHLYVTFEVEPDARFERHGDDLLTQVSLHFAQAALGARVRVPTIEGEEEISVEPGTQPGSVRVLKGRGMPNVHGRGKGDLAVQWTIQVPRRMSAEQRQLIEQLSSLDPDPVTPGAASSDDSENGDGDGGGIFRRKRKKS